MNEHKLFTQRIGLIGITNLLVGLSVIILLPILTKRFPSKNMVSGFRLVLNDKPVLIDVRSMFDGEEAKEKELYYGRL